MSVMMYENAPMMSGCSLIWRKANLTSLAWITILHRAIVAAEGVDAGEHLHHDVAEAAWLFATMQGGGHPIDGDRVPSVPV